MKKLNISKKKNIKAAKSLKRMIDKYVEQDRFEDAFREMEEAFLAASRKLGESMEGNVFRKLYNIVRTTL